MSLASAFATLGVLPSASQLGVRKAYLKAALKAHPDKGGSNDKFRCVVDAFEVIVASAENPTCPRRDRVGGKRTWQQTFSGEQGKKDCSHSARSSARARGDRPHPSSDASPSGGAESSGSPGAGSAPSVEELLAMSEDSWAPLLRLLPRAALEHISSRTQSHKVDAEEKAASVSKDDVRESDSEHEGEPSALALQDVQSFLDSELHADADVDECRPGCRPSRGKSTNLTKGVMKRSHGRYCAMVFLKPFTLRSHDVRALEEAIEAHIVLTQIRQLFLLKTRNGTSFEEAFGEAVHEGLQARPQDTNVAMRLSFTVIRGCMGSRYESPATQNTETAKKWSELMYSMPVLVPEWLSLRQEMLSAATEERVARKASKRAERAALHAQQVAEQRKRMALHKQVRMVIRALEAVERSHFKARWGCARLPAGLVEATLFESNDMICAQLTVQSKLVLGPLRSSVGEAQQDLEQLSTVQKAQGDEAMLELMHRLDVDAMTRHYVQSSRQR